MRLTPLLAIGVGLGAFLLTLALGAPLRLGIALAGLDQAGLTARAVEGSLWAGEIRDAAWGGVSLGDAGIGLAPLSLVLGQPEAALRANGALAGRLRVSAGPNWAIRDARVSAPLQALAVSAPLQGVLELDRVALRMRQGQCASASGMVRLVDVSVPGAAGLAPLSLEGPLACAPDGAAQATLSSGDAASGPLRVDLSLTADGRYRAQILARAGDQALAAAGFQPGPEGYVHVSEGVFGHAAP